mmetsp:Transcript_27350/g.68717  ORF Transcript_27350/g.68717 Transcript_27350/m.68717 type:complete len:236 (-) Transcript_27350:498-1205(-)
MFRVYSTGRAMARGSSSSHHSADERRRSAASAGPHAKHVAEHRGRKARDAVLRRSHEVHQLLVGVVSQLAALGRAAVHLILALTGRPGGHGRVPQLALQVVLERNLVKLRVLECLLVPLVPAGLTRLSRTAPDLERSPSRHLRPGDPLGRLLHHAVHLLRRRLVQGFQLGPQRGAPAAQHGLPVPPVDGVCHVLTLCIPGRVQMLPFPINIRGKSGRLVAIDRWAGGHRGILDVI